MNSFKSKLDSEKVLQFMIIVFAIFILILMNMIFMKLSLRSKILGGKYSYSCNSFEEQIDKTNDNTIKYYADSIESSYDSILISPLGMQSSVYEYYDYNNQQKPEVFSYLSNGFKTWDESRRLFNYDCFITFLPNSIESNDDLIGRALNETDGYINLLGVDTEYNTNSLYSIFNLPYSVKKGKYNTEDDLIYYDGELGYKKTDNYESLKLPMSSNKYELYLIDGDIKSFDFNDFKECEGLVAIDSYTWQSYGKVNGFANALGYNNSDLVMLSQFGFSSDNNEIVNEINSITENKFYYVSEFSFIITDKETGLILALGKHV